MVDSTREVCGSMRVGEKNLKNVWQNDKVKDAVERKEAAQGEVLGVRDEITKDRYMEVYKKEKGKGKRFIYQGKKEVNEQFGRKMNQDVDVRTCFGRR